MNITLPSTSKPGTLGNLRASGVNFKTVQDLLARFGHPNVRFAIDKIAIVSNGVDTVSNGATLIVKEVNENQRTAATLSTALTGANNDIVLTAVTKGLVGNGVSLTLVDPLANDHALVVTVSGTDITATLATGVAGAITTTASLLVAALAASAAAADLVTAALKSPDTGAGVVTALAKTNLAGGLDYVILSTLVASTDLADSDAEGMVQELTLASGRTVVEGNHSLLLSITGGSTATADVKDILVDFSVL